MNNPDTLDKISRIAKVVFFFSMLVLFISLLPVLFGLRNGELLTGAAGFEPSPDATTPEAVKIEWINSVMAYISAIIGAIGVTTSSITSMRKSKIESDMVAMKLKTSQLQHEMQMKEIEILKLELEKESREKKNTAKGNKTKGNTAKGNTTKRKKI